jgi:hypothetical protein
MRWMMEISLGWRLKLDSTRTYRYSEPEPQTSRARTSHVLDLAYSRSYIIDYSLARKYYRNASENVMVVRNPILQKATTSY